MLCKVASGAVRGFVVFHCCSPTLDARVCTRRYGKTVSYCCSTASEGIVSQPQFFSTPRQVPNGCPILLDRIVRAQTRRWTLCTLARCQATIAARIGQRQEILVAVFTNANCSHIIVRGTTHHQQGWNPHEHPAYRQQVRHAHERPHGGAGD